jgi:hypothetical protein
MTVLLLAVVTATAAACGEPEDPGDGVASLGGAATPSASANAAAGGEDDGGLKFAQCMRENGMTWFEDPEPGQRGLKIAVPPGTDRTKFEAAMKTCRTFLPHGGEPGKMDPQALEQARKMSKCMRENGIPNFPDPGPDGGIQVQRGQLNAEPGDPVFEKAEKACARYAPSGAERPATNP